MDDPPGRPPHARWRAGQPAPTERHGFYLSAWRALRLMRHEARADLMETIRDWAGRPARTVTRMGEDDVARLAGHRLADVGGHTRSHPVMSSLPAAAQDEEVRLNAEALSAITGRRPTAFSYPFGRSGDYDRHSRDAVRRTGFTLACCNRPGAVSPWNDPYELPRIYVNDMPGADLERDLAQWG